MITAFRNENAFLSNMHECKFKWQGREYPSLENAYQAMKCERDIDRIPFTQCSPSEAKKMGKKVKMVEGFDNIKYRLMRNLLDVKFDDNKDLRQRLLETAPDSLVEGNWWHDNYWGWCQCDKCKKEIHQNMLGELLQRKRNLSATRPDTFTMYGGSIYHRDTQTMISQPALVYDADGFVMLKVGNFEMCKDYFNTIHQANQDVFSKVQLFTFNRPTEDNPMALYSACEKMNESLLYSGDLKRILGME